MNTDADIWLGFASTFGMLFVVLGIFFLAFYLFRRFSKGLGKGSGNLIRVLALHHLSPKEKLVLVRVDEQTLLIGVTPSRISKLADIDNDSELLAQASKAPKRFSDLLGRSLKKRAGEFPTPDRDQTHG